MSSPAVALLGVEEGLPKSAEGWVRLLRHGLLAAGFVVLVAVGIVRTVNEDAGGLALVVGGLAGLVFVTTRTITALVWLLVLADGVLGILGSFHAQWLEAGAGALGLLVSLAPLPAAAIPDAPPTAMPGPADRPIARLRIRTTGGLELVGPDGDLTSSLRRFPSQTFIWLFLLIRAATGDRVTSRRFLGVEFSPNIDSEEQQSRIRRRLSDMARDLPKPLAECLIVDRKDVTFDLAGCDFDLDRLFDLRRRAKAAGPLLTAELATEVDGVLTAMGFGLVLPEWEEIADAQTEGRGSTGDVIDRLRGDIDEARSDLVLAIASTHLASGRPADAIPLLKSALKQSPEREDLAVALRNTYMATNQPDLAAKIGRSYLISEVR